MRKLALLVLTVCINLVVVARPAAADTVTVHLDVDVATAVPMADCDVVVTSGANGLAVLDQAVADGCIDGYQTRTFTGLGEKVTCIDDVCETPDETLNALTWIVYVDGAQSELGVSSLSFPTHGTTLGFSYEAWPVYAPCWFVGVCP
jgi:hypothetical protein